MQSSTIFFSGVVVPPPLRVRSVFTPATNPATADRASMATSSGAKWAQKTVTLPPLRRGCHLITPKILKEIGQDFHLSKLDQVQSTLKNFFMNVKEDLYLLQVDPKKLGDGLIYEAVDDVNSFPHFYGPDKTFLPLPLDSVVKAEKLTFINGNFTCSFLTT